MGTSSFEKAFSDNLKASFIQKASPFWFSDSSEKLSRGIKYF